MTNSKSVRQIAKDTGFTVNTMGCYLKKAYKKLNVHSRRKLVKLLDRIGVTENHLQRQRKNNVP
ncbi:MAG: hypothetical protein IJB76_00595 [Clostridia bacterium]|nr:hypothetical protein [Clostridia bacterium]